MPLPIAWNQIKQTGNVPSPRSGHTIVTIGKTHYLFGGLEKPEKYNDPKDLLPRMNSTLSGSSTTRPSSGLTSSVQEICPLAAVSTQPARSRRTRCSSSEAATPPTNATTTPFYLKLRTPSLTQPTSSGTSHQTRNPRSPQECMSKIGGPEPRAYHSMTLLQEQDRHLRRTRRS